ncbi:hypothetical protein Tco_1501698 [Tanacetum coccineum]
MSEFNQTSQFAEAVSSILGIVDQYLASKMKEAVDVAVRLQSNKLKEEAEAENQEFFNQIEKYVTESLRAEVLVRSTNQPQTSYAVATSLSEFKLKKILIDKMETNKLINKSDIQKNLYNALVEAYNMDKDIITSYGDVVTLKRGRDDQDKDEDPSAGSDRGTKEESKSTQVEESEFEAVDLEMQQDQGNESRHIDDQPDNEDASKHDWFQKPDKPPTPDRAWNKSKSIDNLRKYTLVRPAFNLLKGTCKSFAELEYHFEECYKDVNDRLDWHNPVGREYPFDLSKPLPLIEDRGRQVVLADYFINNNLEYLKGGCSSSKYATSTKGTKAAKYDNIEGIEYMVPTLWSLVKVAYNKQVVWGTYHRGLKRQRFYAYACHWKSLHDVYSKRRIIVVTSVKIMRWYDYGYLEEIVVRRDDNVLYKFKEGDFPRLNLRDIEDMLLLLVQKKLSNLDVDDRYDLGVALRIPETTRSNISKLTPYSVYKNPQGIIYQVKYKRNRLMCSDELYNFYDETLLSVRSVFNDIASNLEMDYLPKRYWINLEMKRSCIMVKAIDKLLFERRLMHNLEKFVGGRDYGNDLRLLEWTI